MKLRWRMPDSGKPIDKGDAEASHIPALARAWPVGADLQMPVPKP